MPPSQPPLLILPFWPISALYGSAGVLKSAYPKVIFFRKISETLQKWPIECQKCHIWPHEVMGRNMSKSKNSVFEILKIFEICCQNVVFVVFYQILAKHRLNELNDDCGWILWVLTFLNWGKKDFSWKKSHVKWSVGNRQSLVKSPFWSIISYQKSKKNLKIFLFLTDNHLKLHFRFFQKFFKLYKRL